MMNIRTGILKRLFSQRRCRRRLHEEECQEPSIKQAEESCDDNGAHQNKGNGSGRLRCDDNTGAVHGGTGAEDAFSNRPVWRCFSFEEIFSATHGFSPENLVGKGGYAEVYKGTLADGQNVAVKKLTKPSTDERREGEFLAELGTIGHVSHPNVSSLLGCCIDNGLFLIFHFSPGGSVASKLHDENLPALEWEKRYKIAVGTARGLHYLHKGCQRKIIHRDIKASNILLSQDFEPLISDFGLAKWLPTQWTHHSTGPIEGTVGYLAPEYFSQGLVDEKTDVYAFGVFLLELISGKRPVDASHQCLRSWAKPFINKGLMDRVVDPRLKGAYDVSELRRMAIAASLCLRLSSNLRPTMSEVLEVLVGGELNWQRWEISEKEEEKEYCSWDFEELEHECDFSFSISIPDNTISTGSS